MRPSDTAIIEGRVGQLEKEVSALKDILNVYENWNSEVKSMFGKEVKIESSTETIYQGKLIWSDRYCVCIQDNARKRRLILNKGGIVSMSLL